MFETAVTGASAVILALALFLNSFFSDTSQNRNSKKGNFKLTNQAAFKIF